MAGVATCDQCGTEFPKRSSKAGQDKKYCSVACYADARRVYGSAQERIRLNRQRYKAKRRTHTRAQIAEQAKLKKIKAARPCGECGVEFTPVYGDKRRVFCSDACGYKAQKRSARIGRKAKLRCVTVESVNPNKVFERDGWRCHLCGKQTRKDKRGSLHPLAPELDHIIPISKGGEHSYANTACSCRKCNATKSDRIIGQPSLLAA